MTKKNDTSSGRVNNPETPQSLERENLMQQLLQNIPSALLRLDRESRVVYSSDAFLKLMGTDDFEGISGRSLAELHTLTGNDDLAGPILELFQYVEKGNQSVTAEILMNFPGVGEKRPFTIQASRLVDEDGVFDGVIALCHDVTDTRNAESEERTQIMLDATPLACFLMGEDGAIYDCNKEAITLFDAESAQDFEERFFDFMPEYLPSGRPYHDEALNRLHAVMVNGSQCFEWVHRRLNGQLFPAEVTMVRVNWQGGYRIAAYVRDLTEVRANEEKRRQAEGRARTMLDAMPYACVFLDDTGKAVDCNAAATRLFDVSDKEVFLERYYDWMPEYQSNGLHSLTEKRRCITETLETGYSRSQWMYRTTLGEELPAEVTLVRIEWNGIFCIAAYIHDLRSIYEQEKETREAEERVRAMLDATPLACTLWKEDGTMIDCNQEALNFVGVKEKADYLKGFRAMSPRLQSDGEPSDRKMVRLMTVVSETGYQRFDWIFRTAEDKPLPVETTLKKIPWKGDYCIAAYIRDLRGIYEKEKEAREAEERTLAMLNATPLACSLWDEDGKMIDCNQQALDLLGVKEKSDYINGFLDLNPVFQPDGEATSEKALRLIKTAFETGYQRFDWMYQTAQGEPMPVETTIKRIPWKGDYRLAAYSRDLRDFLAAQNEKREAEERTLSMLNATPLGCTLWNENAVMIDCNQQVLDLLGIKEKSDYINRFFDFNPEFQPDGESTAQKAVRFGKVAFETGYQRFDWTYLTAQGELLPAETTLRRIPGKDGYLLAAYSRDLRDFLAAQNEKREAEERMRQMLDTSPLICTMWDENLNLIDCNREALRVFGATDKKQFLKTFPLNFIPEYQSDGSLTHIQVVAALRTAFDTGYYRYECTYLDAAGEPLPTETIHIRIAWKGSYHIIVYCRDLRESIAAQNEKDEAEERVRQMLDTSPYICTMWDENLNIIDCNKETLRIFNMRDKEEFLKTFPQGFCPEYQSDGSPSHLKGLAALQTALDTGYHQYECTYMTATGELLPTETILIRIAWKDNYHIIVYCRDLRSLNEKEKEILKAEQALTRKKDHLDIVAGASKFTYWDLDLLTDKLSFSHHIQDEFGYAPEEIGRGGFLPPAQEDSTLGWLDLIHPDDAGRVARDLQDYVTGKSDRYWQELRFLHKNGEYLWTVSTGRIVEWKDGKPSYMIGGFFNVNDLKKTESANTAKSRFLASMSHEIRTPMNAIIGMSDLIRMDNMDTRQKEFFHDLRLMSKSLLQIINDILDFSKIESDKMELSPIHFDLLNLYDNIVSLNRFMAEGKGLELRSSFGDDVTQIVYGDDVRIRQIVTNLLSNAIKYTRDGFVDLRVRRVVENGQVYTAFIVEDTGIGIRKENFPKLFDWYEQFDTTQNRGIAGTGLGLPITKRFTDMMNGRVDVKSKYGKGSVFTVLLPIPEGNPKKVERVAASSIFVTDGSAKVLVVDDNTINLKVALAYLEIHNIHADIAESGIEALKKIKEKQYHLIFMDHMMPEMDGIETTARIRAANDEWRRTVPIIALSANAVSGARDLFLGSGMNDFLYKPIDAGELNRLLAKWLPPEIITKKPIPAKTNTAMVKTPRRGENNSRLVIDRAAGIANAVGSETLYQQLLTDFKFSHGVDLQKITAALEAGDQQTARRIAHTLKSTANLIGAKPLGNAAMVAEKALEVKSKSVPLAQSMRDTLEKEFNAVMAELEQIAPGSAKEKPHHQVGTLDITRSLALIKKLEPLLESGSSVSLNLLDDIREILAPVGKEYEELASRIEDLDFAEAAEVLSQIKEKVSSSMPVPKGGLS